MLSLTMDSLLAVKSIQLSVYPKFGKTHLSKALWMFSDTLQSNSPWKSHSYQKKLIVTFFPTMKISRFSQALSHRRP
ncbi:PHD finger protein [Musa troglodytarum]|uniref:PHD finger protein n=1 Tax=Musa troglodytarum TaxID=320322 RepID=A0A9E7GEQ0_9LILI|nr:PHD finger protein [Musa troglodytarum]